MRRYNDAAGMRRAPEQRLKMRAVHRGLPLDRLRKEAALQRLLARIAVAAPPGSPAVRPEQQLAEEIHAYTRDYGIAFPSLGAAYAALQQFWSPVFAEPSPVSATSRWNADTWSWTQPAAQHPNPGG